MITRISEIIHEWMGWCPNARTIPENTVLLTLTPTDISSSSRGPGISRRIILGFHLMKGSGQIVMQDKSLLWFSLFAGLVMLFEYLASDAISFFMGIDPVSVASHYPSDGLLISWAGFIFIVYLVYMFFSIFILIGLLLCISAKMRGERMTVWRGLSDAVNHLRAALLWIVVLAAAFTIIRIMMSTAVSSMNLGYCIFILSGAVLVGAMTMFVVPILVFERKGLTTAIPNSISIFRKTWGEIAGGLGIFPLIYIAIAFIDLLILSISYTIFPIFSIVVSTLFFLLLNIFLFVVMLIGGIFLIGLYSMEKTGTIPILFTNGCITEVER